MARPLRIEYPGAFYHILQRGNAKQNIFNSDEDRYKFFEYITSTHNRFNILIHSYCLLSNHYHLIVETPEANLARAMHFLNASYAAYFVAKYKFVGHLFQGRYKSILVQRDEYLHHLSRYIHLNPVRAKFTTSSQDYKWSSYKYFITGDNLPNWLVTHFILSMFDENIKKAKILYKDFVLENIGKEIDIIRNNIKAGSILGDEDFVESIKKKFLKDSDNKEIPSLRELKSRPTLKMIADLTKKEVKNNRLSRKLSIYLAKKYTGKRLSEIAAYFGRMGDTGISHSALRTEKERRQNKSLDKLIGKLEERLNRR